MTFTALLKIRASSRRIDTMIVVWLLLLCYQSANFLPAAWAFSPSRMILFRRQQRSLDCRNHRATQLSGVRKSIAHTLAWPIRTIRRRRQQHHHVDTILIDPSQIIVNQTMTTTTTTTTTEPSHSFGRDINHNVPTLRTATTMEPTTTTTTLDKLQQLLLLQEDNIEGPLYELPPPRSSYTPLEQEFRDMVQHFTTYSRQDVCTISHVRLRVLLEGIMASAGCPAVYRAFEVLYQDLYPLRVAGRIIYQQLCKALTDSVEEHNREVATVMEATSEHDRPTVSLARLVFLRTALRLNRDVYLTAPQLLATSVTETAQQQLGLDGDDLLKRLLDHGENDDNNKLQFVGMIVGLQQCANEVCIVEEEAQRCNPVEIVHQVLEDLIEHPPQMEPTERDNDPKRVRMAQRYDKYVEAFRQWESLFTVDGATENSNGHNRQQERLIQVMEGCFVGANTPEVVHALKVLYLDYSGLRFAGDLIFKLASGLMQGRRRRLEKKQQQQQHENGAVNVN